MSYSRSSRCQEIYLIHISSSATRGLEPRVRARVSFSSSPLHLSDFMRALDVERLSALDERLSALDGRLSALPVDGRLERLSALDEKLSALDRRLGGMDGRLGGMDGRLSAACLVVRDDAKASPASGGIVKHASNQHGCCNGMAMRSMAS